MYKQYRKHAVIMRNVVGLVKSASSTAFNDEEALRGLVH